MPPAIAQVAGKTGFQHRNLREGSVPFLRVNGGFFSSGAENTLQVGTAGKAVRVRFALLREAHAYVRKLRGDQVRRISQTRERGKPAKGGRT